MRRAITALLAATAAGALAGAPALAKEYIYGSWFGANHSVNQMGLAPYFEKLAEETGGEIEWKLVPGAQLANGPGTPEAVGTGLMDAGLVMAPYQPRMLPTTNLIFCTRCPARTRWPRRAR